jgi:hypothetical protein
VVFIYTIFKSQFLQEESTVSPLHEWANQFSLCESYKVHKCTQCPHWMSRHVIYIVMRLIVARDKVWIGNWIYWTLTLVTTYIYTVALPITVTRAHTKSSQSSVAFAWQRLSAANVLLPLWVPEMYPDSATCFHGIVP